ncbi:uncharacterized protein LOC100994157 isoform X1 [Pan paniscus]|uniref:uncharacterized protein LOC100994157 isoform X1 n=1 Tax=Pan paniscus TaxID=9597 RepID=UPI0024368DDE|nr:uncharacterized protein LOC100994157 isoform X1 [Pan paniscus]
MERAEPLQTAGQAGRGSRLPSPPLARLRRPASSPRPPPLLSRTACRVGLGPCPVRRPPSGRVRAFRMRLGRSSGTSVARKTRACRGEAGGAAPARLGVRDSAAPSRVAEGLRGGRSTFWKTWPSALTQGRGGQCRPRGRRPCRSALGPGRSTWSQAHLPPE